MYEINDVNPKIRTYYFSERLRNIGRIENWQDSCGIFEDQLVFGWGRCRKDRSR